MREIKFKAWDKKYKKMYHGGDIRIALAFPDEDIEFMQYTGLKDKNGKEGYHHSLIKHEFRNQGNPIEIIWDDGSWKGRYCGSRFSGFALNQWEMSQAEIIGNLYDNPELSRG